MNVRRILYETYRNSVLRISSETFSKLNNKQLLNPTFQG